MPEPAREHGLDMLAGREGRPVFVGTRPSLHEEPGLDELLQDPIMTLLWRRDRLDPEVARRQVWGLQALVRQAANDPGRP